MDLLGTFDSVLFAGKWKKSLAKWKVTNRGRRLAQHNLLKAVVSPWETRWRHFFTIVIQNEFIGVVWPESRSEMIF
jgi:hypothetical protein